MLRAVDDGVHFDLEVRLLNALVNASAADCK
jgi:hypothetical protein